MLNQSEKIKENSQFKKKEETFEELENSQLFFVEQENYNQFFCSLCGSLILIINVEIDQLPLRKTDNSLCIDMISLSYRSYLKEAGKILVQRVKGLELQYKLDCECGNFVGYQCIPYEESQTIGQQKQLNIESIKYSNKPILYIFSDGVVSDPKYSKLMQELINRKNQ